MTFQQKKDLFNTLSQHVTPERLARFQQVAAQRTDYITVVLEDIYQSHNANAVLRTCDGLGIGSVHVIEDQFQFKAHHSVAKGGEKWINVPTYRRSNGQSTETCFAALREQGYTIAATTPHTNDMHIQDLPIDKPVALVFGNEQTGLSEYAMQHADMFVKIPLYGFVESYNISVSTAICLYELTKRVRDSQYNWQLSEEEQLALQVEWLLKTTAAGQEELKKMKTV